MFITGIDGGSYIRFADDNIVVDGDQILISYRYTITDDSENINGDCRDEMIKRTGGDGIHQFLYTQTSGMVIRDIDDLNQLEDILLSRKCKILRRGQFKVWQKGDLLETIWIAGQTFERDLGSELSIERMYVISTDKIIG